MTTAATITNDWISQICLSMYRGKTPPNTSKFYVALANTAILTRANAIADFITQELLPVNGYARQNTQFSGDGAYNPTNLRHEMPTLTATFTASGNSFQFQTAFLIANASAVASQSFTDANVNASSDRITILNHGYANGDNLVFTADNLSTLPSGITAGILYTVNNITTNDFQIQLSGATVDIQNTGSGTLHARSANGSIVALAVESSPITVPAGQGYTYQIPIVQLNTGYTNGI